MVTERDIANTVAANVKWLHPLRDITDLASLAANDVLRVYAVMTPMVLQSQDTLSNVAAICDEQLGLAPGLSLSVARHLLANRLWRVDMNQPIQPNQKLTLLAVMPMEAAQVSRGSA